MLSVLYQYHCNFKIKNAPKDENVAVKECRTPISPKQEQSDDFHVVKMNPKAVTLLCENEDDVYSGKLPCLKLLCSILGAQEPSQDVRYVALPGVARKLITAAVESMNQKQINDIAAKLHETVS